MAETKTINLDVKTNIGSLKAQLQAAQREVYLMSEAFGATSREAAEAAIKAASLKDAIEDAKNLTDAFNPDAKFNALSSSIGGVLNGFQAFEGAMGLLGVESEELQKTLLKVQSAMALSQGIQGLLEAKDSFVQLGAVAKNALSGIRAGIAATGIGLLVVALGTIVAYWDDIKSAVSGVSAEQAKLNEQTDANLLAQKAKYDAISGQDNILKLQGKSERDILKIKQTQIQAVIKATEAQLVQQEATKKAQIAAAKRNREILEGMITFITAPLQFVLKTIDLAGKALGKDFGLQKGLTKGLASLVFDPEAVEEEGDKTIQETKNKLAQLKNEAAGFTIALKEMDKPAENVVTKSSEKVVEEAKKEVETLELFKLDSVRTISSQIQAERRKELEAEMANSLEKRRIAKEEADAIIALEAEKKKAREDALTATASTLGQIADLFGQQTAAGKAAAIAEATIQTYLSAQKAYQSTVGIPVVGPVLAPINAGLAIAAGIKNIKAITAVKTPDGGGGGGGNLSNNFTSGAQAPSFNVVGNSGMNQLAQIQQTPIQAYVVSGEVTSAQALDRNRVKNATL